MIYYLKILYNNKKIVLDLNLRGKKALVTGSSKGIGKNIAEALSKEGCYVAINSRDKKYLNEINSKLENSFAIPGDVTNPIEAKKIVNETISHFESLDILVCNVGSGKSVKPGLEDYHEWKNVFKKNLFSSTNIIEESREYLAASKGSIICISSICGLENIFGAPVTYSVAKSALNSYVKFSSRNLGRVGIRINAIAPGNIYFNGSVWSEKMREDREAVKAMLKREVSLGKLGTPEDISSLTCFLASPVSNFITGSIFKVDGGQVRS